MRKLRNAEVRNLLLALFFIAGLAAALVYLPYEFRTQAGGNQKGLVVRTSSSDDGIVKMYDIREDKARQDELANMRSRQGKSFMDVATLRDKTARAEAELMRSIPNSKVEYNTDIRIPEVITPDMGRIKIDFLTPPSSEKRVDILKNFIGRHQDLVGVDRQQIDALKVSADYTNPDGNISYVNLDQEINGIPVFRGEIKAGFTRDNRIIRVINNLAPDLDYSSLSTEFGDPAVSVAKAAAHINHEMKRSETIRNDAASTDLKVVFGEGDWATTAEKMYFPTEPGVAVPSWRVLIWQPVNAYYVIVDAESGAVLWHKNITDDQAQSATYQVYRNLNAYIPVEDHAAPLSPGPNDPGLGTQGALLTRNNVSLIGNEGPLSFNNNGWINDNTNVTDGNANEAGIDRDGTNGVDAPQPGDTACPGAGCRVFTSTWNPPPGSPAPGDAPLTTQAQRGAVIQMFYIMNRYHDELYLRGFNEAARNFQNVNFTGQGLGSDRVSSEGQDSSGTNNANFSTPGDGTRGRMQMYLWTGPTPQRDGTADADIVIHEVTHGTSNRIHGNGTGLGNQGGMMGEGWGDWYAHTMLAEPTDNVNGVYGLGGYSLLNLGAGWTANFYYGIRRFPTALIASTAGPNRPGCNNGPCPHNPLTFGHINSTCDTTLGTTTTAVTSAFPRSSVIATSGSCSQVHNAGEIWKSALWEVRSLFIARKGFAVGTRDVLQVVTDGMKLSPVNPMMLQERDGILAAAAAISAAPEASADVADVWEGFRRRGFGFSASTQSSTAVTEAFDLPNAVLTNPFTVTDPAPGGNNNGVPEPGETVKLGIAVTNGTGTTVNNVTVTVDGGSPVAYGNINDGQTVTQQINYAIPGNAACGSTRTVSIVVSSPLGSQPAQQRSFVLGSPAGLVENFDGVTAPALPAGWTMTQDTGTAITWTTTTTGPDSAPNSAFANDPATVNMSSLVSPSIPVTSAAAQLKFRNKYITESTFDGMVLEIAIGAGAYQDILTAGGSFVTGGYNATISTNFSSPIAGRQAWSGTSAGGYIDTVVNLPAAANGQNIRLRWRMATDTSVASTGVNVDGVQVVSSYTCAAVTGKARADFDGDGKTDTSVYRPGANGIWYADRSTSGFMAIQYGTTGDTVHPGDYDGDGKTDFSFWRPSDTPNVPDFYILKSSDSTLMGFSHGLTTDIPVGGDFDGDGKTDIAVFRPSTGTWFIWETSTNNTRSVQFGLNGDVPFAMDSDGDGKANLAVWRPGDRYWYIARNTGVPAQNFDAVQWGNVGDVPVPADYDGDGKEDIAVFRPSDGYWYIIKSTGGTSFIKFGQNGDVPVPGDYDGDGKYDVAVYRSGMWYMQQSTAGFAAKQFGVGSDVPVPAKYHP